MGTIHLVYRVNNCVGFALSLLLNTLLLWLILRHSPSELRTYSIILVQTCVLDLLIALLLVLNMPLVVAVDHALVMFQMGWLSWTALPVNFCIVATTLSILIFHFSALGVQFLYRYLLIVRSIQLTIRQYTAMLGVPLALATITGLLLYIAAYPSLAVMSQVAGVLGPILEVPSEMLIIPAIGAKNSAYILLSAVILSTCTGTYILIAWCSYAVSGSDVMPCSGDNNPITGSVLSLLG